MKKRTVVDLTISQIIDDLNSGMAWMKKDDEGYGSIQEKYGASDINIMTIRKHPKLAGLEPSILIFNIIDDLDTEAPKTEEKAEKPKETKITTKQVKTEEPEVNLESPEDAEHSEDAFDAL